VGTLNVKGAFGSREVVNSSRAFGIVLAKYCALQQIQVLAVQDLNMTPGREKACLLGLKEHGYHGYFQFPSQSDNRGTGVGFIVHNSLHAHKLFDKGALTDGKSRALCIRVRMHDPGMAICVNVWISRWVPSLPQR